MNISIQHISYLERSYLDASKGIVSEVSETVYLPATNHAQYIKVLGISRFWEQSGSKSILIRQLMQDIIAGLHGEKIPLIFLLVHQPPNLNLFIGTYNPHDISTLAACLRSAYPAISFSSRLLEQDLDILDNLLPRHRYSCTAVGSPNLRPDKPSPNNELIERLIRGLNSATAGHGPWIYSVIAVPVLDNEICDLYASVLNESRIIENMKASANIKNSLTEAYQEKLKKIQEKLEIGKQQGMWHTATYFLSDDLNTFSHGKAIIKSVFGGENAYPDPIRVLEYQSHRDEPTKYIPLNSVSTVIGPSSNLRYPYKYLSLLNSKELSEIAHLPSEEFSGYHVKDYARFDVEVSNQYGSHIHIGEITSCGQPVGNRYKASYKNLNRHTMVAGTTGSGKTNTVFYLLKQAWQNQLPFLVIEPAKTEYRKLLQSQEIASSLLVFTLGDDTVSPFRLNPFEIMDGVSVQTHISHLLSVFNASFIMYAPMPYVLEACIHEIYQDRGWNLITGLNERGNHREAHPTLTDLYRKIDEVVDRLGYEERITMDVKAAMKTRINSLRIGGKGLMLDTRQSIPIRRLLQQPTLLELEQVGDDDEKAFIIGLILIFLSEYYRSCGLQESQDLIHLTVIEEAHRLFKNIPLTVSADIANMKGKAVETFCNILSEIRAYGEGFIIAEQIPTKLAPDILKNTNLKIMHRLVSSDDRNTMGATMNLNESQKRRIASLETGEAAIYSEGDDSALLIQIPYSKEQSVSTLSRLEENSVIHRLANKFAESQLNVFAPLTSSLDAENDFKLLKREADQVIEDPELQEVYSQFVLSLVHQDRVQAIDLRQLIQVINKLRRSSQQDMQGIKVILSYGAGAYFERLGQKYRWCYEDVANLTQKFLGLLFDVSLKQYFQNSTGSYFSENELSRLQDFRETYYRMCQIQYYPFANCEKVCPNRCCVFRYNIEPLLKDNRLDTNFANALAKFSGEEVWKQVGEVCRIVDRRVLSSEISSDVKKKTSLCFVIQKSESIPYMDYFLRDKIVVSMLNLLA
jgi:Helicase HerA, central domain